VANSPPDIVLGVALAADPQKYRVAVERLQRMSAERLAGTGANPGAFSTSVEAAGTDAAEAASAVSAGGPPRFVPVSPRQNRNPGDAFGQLEAFVLQTFIQSMLPKNAQHVFGKGLAGDVWKSMLAEKLGQEIARSGQLGIAKRLAAGRFESAATSPGAAAVSLAPPLSGSVANAYPSAQSEALQDNERVETIAPQPSSAPERG
jgi:flagellar protein FlgJ